MHRLTRRSVLGGISTLPLALAATSCGSAKGKFTLGMVEFPGYAPWYLAKERGFFGKTDVSLKRIAAIGDIRSAFKAKTLDGYVATFDIFQSIEGDIPPGKLVLPLVSSNGGDGIVAASWIKSIADLKGRPVVAERGLPPLFVLEYLLDKEGLTLADIKLSDVPSNDVPAAFRKGDFAAAGTYEPLLSNAAEQQSGAHILATSKNTPMLITDFLITSEEMLTDRIETLADVAQGWFEAVKFYRSRPPEAVAIMAAAFEIKADEMAGYGTDVKWLNQAEGFELLDSKRTPNAFGLFDEVGAVLARNNARIRPISAKTAIDLRLARKLGFPA
jgi:NitT/TauT family transport system substrate-binding protein